MSPDVLLIIDIQNDFCLGGSLAVPDGDAVVGPTNRMIQYANENHWSIFATRDWHPAVTNHFKKYGGVWPDHCVADTCGAEFHPALRLPDAAIIISKGVNPDVDALSGFHSFNGKPEWSALAAHLMHRDVRAKKLYVCGLATDYCVKATVLDALRLGYQVIVLEDAIRAVNVDPYDGWRAIQEMRQAGAVFTTTDAIINFQV